MLDSICAMTQLLPGTTIPDGRWGQEVAILVIFSVYFAASVRESWTRACWRCRSGIRGMRSPATLLNKCNASSVHSQPNPDGLDGPKMANAGKHTDQKELAGGS
jgi:hypothetical protein